MKVKYSLFLIFYLAFFVITGCSQSTGENKSQNQAAWKDIDTLISDYIIQEDSKGTVKCDKIFEAHKTYGTNTDENNTYVYTLVLYEQYNFEDGKAKSISFVIEPTVFTLKQSKKDQYTIEECAKPEGGDKYFDNIKKIFTDKYYDQVYQDLHSDNCGGLTNLMESKVNEWLAIIEKK